VSEPAEGPKIVLIATERDLWLVRLRAAMRSQGYSGAQIDEIVTDIDGIPRPPVTEE